MPRLSIVIPCLSENEQFENTLISVLRNRPRDCEVLVIYPGTYPDPYDLEGEVCFVETRSEASLLELVHVGWARSTGEVVHILQCGMQVDEGWTDAILARFDKLSIGSVSPLVERQSEDSGRIVAGVRHGLLGRKLVYRASSASPQTAPTILGPTLAAGFYRRAALEEVRGFDAVVGDRYGDVDVALALESAGYDSVCEPSSLVTATRTENQPLGFADARRAERLFWKHLPPHEKTGRIFLHLMTVVAEFLFPFPGPRRAVRLLGRLVGSLEPRIPRRGQSQEVGHVGPPKPASMSHPDARSRNSSSDDRQNPPRRRRVVA
ncbi:MAG: glycosyltransferase family 2 protein [Pirellulaceae bacterium]